jgi:TRAP-type uncharacterized transport system substrate-binding protein
LLERTSGISQDNIKAGTYGGVPALSTISVRALWIVSDREPGDVVFAITRSLFSTSNRKLLLQSSASARNIDLRKATRDLPAPLHPGARKFYLAADHQGPL